MKRVLSVAMVAMMLLLFSGCSSSPAETTPVDKGSEQTTETSEGDTTSKTNEATEESTTETEPTVEPGRPINFETETGVLKYVKHEVMDDYEGNPAMVVYFDYTNKDTEDARNAMFEFNVVGYQNGIEGDIVIIMDGPEELENSMTDIKEGVTLPVAFSFGLQDETSVVELEVSELISFSSDKQTMILKIS